MKPLHFMGSSLKDLKALPSDVRREAGFAFRMAQQGGKALHAFPLVGFGCANVLEVVINEDGNTFRTVYTVKFEMAVYVLHVFQKKSKKGVATPRPDVALIRRRLTAASEHYKMNYASKIRKDVSA